MSDTATFNGVALGDDVVRMWVEVQRAVQPSVLSGVHRKDALLSDDSPNVFYAINLIVHKRASSMVDAARWTLSIGDLMRVGPQTLVVTTSGGTMTAVDATLVGPVSPPQNDQANPAIVDRLHTVFHAAPRPR